MDNTKINSFLNGEYIYLNKCSPQMNFDNTKINSFLNGEYIYPNKCSPQMNFELEFDYPQSGVMILTNYRHLLVSNRLIV